MIALNEQFMVENDLKSDVMKWKSVADSNQEFIDRLHQEKAELVAKQCEITQ